MDGLVFKRAFFFNDKGQNSSSKNQQQDLHVLSPQYKKYLIQIRDRERKVIKKSNGEVLPTFFKNRTFKSVSNL